MAQRVGLARVATHGGAFWLLDEPTTGLDASGRAVLLTCLRSAIARGVAVLCASHDDQLTAAADRVVHLRGGCLYEDTL